MVIVTALVVTRVVVTGAEVHSVSTKVLVTVTSVEHGSEVDTMLEPSSTWLVGDDEEAVIVTDETKEDATGDVASELGSQVDNTTDSDEPREEPVVEAEDEPATEIGIEGEKCHDVASSE